MKQHRNNSQTVNGLVAAGSILKRVERTLCASSGDTAVGTAVLGSGTETGLGTECWNVIIASSPNAVLQQPPNLEKFCIGII